MSKKLKQQKYYTEEQKEIRKFVFIILGLFVIIGAIYFITDKFVEEGNNQVLDGEINFDKATIGTLLNRPYEEYYALIYNSESTNSPYYSSIKNGYTGKSDSIKLYFIDLKNDMNSKYYNKNNDGKSNSNAKTIEDLNLGDITLIKVKNGEIISYIDNVDNIVKELK